MKKSTAWLVTKIAALSVTTVEVLKALLNVVIAVKTIWKR